MKGVFLGNGKVGVPPLEAFAASLGSGNVKVITKFHEEQGVIERSARGMDVPVKPVQMTKEGLLQAVGDINFDVALIVSFGVILPESLLKAHPDKFFNMHFSLLPAYRGPAPVQRSILAGDTTFGITLQEVAPEIDAGRIVMQQEIEFTNGETASEIFAALSDIAGKMVPEFLQKHEDQALEYRDQVGEVTNADKIDRKEGLINSEMSAEEAWRKYRAFKVRPGIYVEGVIKKDGKPDKPVRVKILGMSKNRSHKHDFHFKFPDGELYVQQAQLPGKNPTNASGIRSGYHGTDGHSLLVLDGFGASDYSDAASTTD